MNKRGDEELLPKETLNLIIALICIAVLVILVAAIYFSITGNQDIKKAQAILLGTNGIANEIKRINAGGEANQNFLVGNPSGWYIFSFTGDIKPNNCAGVNCVCICEKLLVGIINADSRQAERCDDKGVCTPVPNIKKFDAIEIKNGGIFIGISKINEEIQIIKK